MRDVTTLVSPLTNGAYGFPRGAVRRVTPIALAAIHITGNDSTAGMTDLHKAAQNERQYANRPGSPGPSAHYYIARDGWAIEAIDPTKYAAWSNGDVSNPHTANPGVACVLAMAAKGSNPNEAYWLEFENVGSNKLPITSAQIQAMAVLIAARATASGLPINRETVHGHWEINGIDRQSCPNPPAQHEAFLADVIARARALLPVKPPGPPAEDPSVRVVTVTIETFPARTFTAAVPLRRFSATTELSPITSPAPYTASVDGDVVIEGNPSAPNGSGFLRLSAGGSAGRYILAASVTLEA